MKDLLSISPSLLNNFHALKSGMYETWGKGPEDFLADIIKGAEPNEAMSRGTAYGELLEHGLEKYARHPYEVIAHTNNVNDPDLDVAVDYSKLEYAIYESDLGREWLFTEAEVAPIQKFRGDHPNAVYEVWGDLRFNVDGEDVRSRMRLDGMEYLTGYEFKTSSKAKGYKDRVDSYQWKMYLMAYPELQKLIYHEYQFMKRGRFVKESVHEFSRYPGMEKEVINAVTDCVRWLRQYPEAIEARTKSFKD